MGNFCGAFYLVKPHHLAIDCSQTCSTIDYSKLSNDEKMFEQYPLIPEVHQGSHLLLYLHRWIYRDILVLIPETLEEESGIELISGPFLYILYCAGDRYCTAPSWDCCRAKGKIVIEKLNPEILKVMTVLYFLPWRQLTLGLMWILLSAAN